MKNIIQFPDALNADDDTSTQAAYWLAKMDSGLVEPQEFKDFLRWKRADPQNAVAYIELSNIFSDADSSSANNRATHVNDAAALKPALARDKNISTQGRYLTFSLKISIAASVLIGLFVLLVSGLPLNSQTPQQSLDLMTQIGEQHNTVLKDGSQILLNTQSQVKVRFKESERSVHLVSGEAHFDVAHDPKRPFRVYTPHGNVSAVGTAFSINLVDQELAVTVTEGRIAVSSADAYGRQKNRPLAMVDAGHQVRVSNDVPQVNSIDTRAMEKQIAWHSGLLIFDGDSLTSVIAQISRYTDKHFVIADENIGQVKIGGQFRTTEIEGLLESLDSGFGISAHYTKDNKVLLSRKKGFVQPEPRA